MMVQGIRRDDEDLFPVRIGKKRYVKGAPQVEIQKTRGRGCGLRTAQEKRAPVNAVGKHTMDCSRLRRDVRRILRVSP